MLSEITLDSIRPRAVSDGVDFLLTVGGEKVTLSLPDSLYTEWSGRVGGVVLPAELDFLTSEAAFFAACEKGIELLRFGDMTKAMLKNKLRQRNFSAVAAERAAEHLALIGALNEERFAKRALSYYLEKKHYGRSRIESEMYAKGFDREAVEDALGLLLPEDTAAACKYQIDRLFGGELPKDPAEYKKALAALGRRGFTRSDVNAARELSD